MWNTRYNKAVVLVVLGVSSSAATMMCVTHLGLAQSTPPGPNAAPPTKTSIRAFWGPAPALQAPNAGVRSIAGGTIKLTGIETEGRNVHVAAAAFIQDTRPNMQYIWSIRVTHPTDKTSVVFDKLYHDQIFDLGEQQAMETNFEDIIEIPRKAKAGKYRLELTWIGIHPDSGLEGLNDFVVRERFKGASAVATITIP